MPLRDLTTGDLAGTILPESIVDRTPPEVPFKEDSVFLSAMRKDFVPASMAAFHSGKPGADTPDEEKAFLSGEYDYETDIPDDLKEYEVEYAKYATSARKANWITENIRQQQRDNAVLADGGVAGFLSTMLAAGLSPEQWPTYVIPGAILLKANVLRGSRAAIVGVETAVATTGAAVGELALHGSQAVRTKEESAFAIAGSAILSGIITTGLVNAKGVGRSAQQLLSEVDADIKIGDGDFRVDEIDPRSMGAAEAKADIVETHRMLVERAENDLTAAKASGDEVVIKNAQTQLDELASIKAEKLTELKHPKLAKALGFISPAVRLAGSRVSSARELASMLVDDPMLRVRHKYGDTLGPSIETQITQFETEMGMKTVDALDTGFKIYKKTMKESGEKAIPREEFARQVGKAMRNGDEALDGNELVTKAAKILRSEVAEPIQSRLDAQDMLDRRVTDYSGLTADDLIEAGVEPDKVPMYFKEDGTTKANIKSIDADARDWLVQQGRLQTEIRTPVGDKSYLHRLWDFVAIREEPGAFDKKVSDYFYSKSQEVVHANTVGRVAARIEKLEVELAALDAKVAKSKKKVKVVERSYQERQAELAKLTKQRDELKAKGDIEGAKAVKTPKRTDAQRTFDKRQQLNYIRDVEAPAAKIKYDEDMIIARKQTDATAMEVRMKIEGQEYNPRMGNDRVSFKEGPLKNRSLAIPSNVISDFVENDIEKVMQQYTRNVAAPLHFKETFDPASPGSIKVGRDPQELGSKAFEAKMKIVGDEYETLRLKADAAGNKKEAAKIMKEWAAVKRDMSAMHESLFNKYGLPDNPSGFWHKARQRLKEFNMMTMLGMMTVSALPDVGNYIARRGLKSFARDMTRLATNFKTLKLSRQMNKRLGISMDLMSSSRIEKMYAMDDQFATISKTTTGGKVLRGWKNTQNVFTQATGMPMWNNFWKSTAATSYIDDILIDAVKLKEGKLSQKAIQGYARGGLSTDTLKKIASQLNTKRDMIDGVWVPDVEKWADQDIANTFKAAVRKEVDMTIVTPGKGDLPLASRNETGKILLQFKSFSMSANNRILLASLDDFTADKVAGALAMVTLGYISYATRQTLKDKEVKTDYDTFVREGIDRSGLLAIWGEVNAIASKATSGELDMFRTLGADKAELTRYASRNMLGAIMGVSAGRVSDIGQITSAVASGDFKETDIRAIRRTIMFNNLWATHRGFTQIEKSLGGSE